MTDGILAVSRTWTASLAVSLISIFELSKGLVVVAITEAGSSAGISSKGEKAPSLRCTDVVVGSSDSDEGLGIDEPDVYGNKNTYHALVYIR